MSRNKEYNPERLRLYDIISPRGRRNYWIRNGLDADDEKTWDNAPITVYMSDTFLLLRDMVVIGGAVAGAILGTFYGLQNLLNQ